MFAHFSDKFSLAVYGIAIAYAQDKIKMADK
jgi:hypothetical protein